MNHEQFWNNWMQNLDYNFQNEKLIQSKTEKYTPVYRSKSGLICVFEENKSVVCNLGFYRCNCEEFNTNNPNNLPCRHMYRTAIECDLTDGFGHPIKENSMLVDTTNTQIQFISLIHTIETTMTNDQQLQFMDSIPNSIRPREADCLPNPQRYKRAEIDQLLSLGVFEKIDDANIYYIYGVCGVYSSIADDILSSNISIPKGIKRNRDGSISKRAINAWALTIPDIVVGKIYENQPFEYIVARPAKQFLNVYDCLVEYMNRKFVDSSTYNLIHEKSISHPFGAEVINFWKEEFRFPYDFITDLLDKYNNNRCCNYKSGSRTKPFNYIHKKHALWSLSVRMISEGDKRTILEFIEKLADFYAIHRRNIKDYVEVLLTLKEVDLYLESVAMKQETTHMLIFKNILKNAIKPVNEVKSDFQSISATFADGSVTKGYIDTLTHIERGIAAVSFNFSISETPNMSL